MYEFSTTMVISAAMVCNQFHAITTHSWTGWVWFAVLIGPFLIWAFTAVYSALAPDTIITNV
jgi:phospholipid-translocating ATPase